MRITQSILSIVVLVIIATLLAVIPGRVSHAQQGGYVIFDLGQDGDAIDIPGLRFTSNVSNSWLYGDVRTRQYNAPFPESCTDRPEAIARPVCEFAVEGSGFAWIGQLGSEATITFTEGTASYFEASFSTGTTLQVVANDSLGRPIDTAVVTSNTGTGQLERIRLEATVDQQITSVVVRGSPNFWLLDNLATDAPGVPDQRPEDDEASPFTVVAQHASPNTSVRPGDIVTYTIVATNRGEGDAEYVKVAMPFDPTEVQVLDAQFSQESAWVSAILSDTLVFETGRISANGGVVTATVRLATLPNLGDGTSLAERLRIQGDGVDGVRIHSNQTIVTVGDTNINQAFYTLNVAPTSETPDATHTFESSIFVPGEPVTLWYHTSQNEDVEVITVTADADGGINVSVATEEMLPGNYTMVARGNWSTLTSIGSFQIE